MRTPSAAPTPTPALAPLFSPLEDDEDDDGDGEVSAAEDVDICNVFITVEEVGEAVVIAGLVDVGTAEADVALVIAIDRELEADDMME
ncbi:hypothetical protein JMJ35_000133 [Cladonia borealis]|uniref:Uncharacterized protein n=1 Tax=Cladonia borealis TaxID=184061 RepID=A0AA39R8U6_9LECA|nr:hypothetical protein JMJ35_000133 [Cladonia borealis]